jgi:hypothetical protein
MELTPNWVNSTERLNTQAHRHNTHIEVSGVLFKYTVPSRLSDVPCFPPFAWPVHWNICSTQRMRDRLSFLNIILYIYAVFSRFTEFLPRGCCYRVKRASLLNLFNGIFLLLWCFDIWNGRITVNAPIAVSAEGNSRCLFETDNDCLRHSASIAGKAWSEVQ